MKQQVMSETIAEEQLKESAPLPEGLFMRPAEMADLEDAVSLFSDCSIVMFGQAEASIEDVRQEWQTPDLKLEQSMRVVCTPQGRLVGYVEVWDLDDRPVNVWVWGRVHPEFEGLGIGTHLMTWAERRARQAIGRAPADARVVMQAGTFNSYDPPKQLLAGLGMTPVRHTWIMEIELDQAPAAPQWPTGVDGQSLTVCNFADFGDARALFRAIREAFADHWGYVEQAEEPAFEHWSHFAFEGHAYDPTLWFLVLDGEEIAGFSICRPQWAEDPETGWVGTLGVRRPWRRQGLGLALLQHSFGELYRRGKKRVGLGVDASSLTGATRLYEKAGMSVARQFDVYEKELRPGRDLRTRHL